MLAGSFFYFNNQSIKEVENEAESIFSSISYNEATEYADEHVYEIDEALLLDHSKSLKIHQLMDVSHGEIQHYLDETGGTLED